MSKLSDDEMDRVQEISEALILFRGIRDINPGLMIAALGLAQLSIIKECAAEGCQIELIQHTQSNMNRIFDGRIAQLAGEDPDSDSTGDESSQTGEGHEETRVESVDPS